MSQQYCGCRRRAKWRAIFALSQVISLHRRHLTRLITLGQLALFDLSGKGRSLLGHKRKLVLLSVLALADGPVSRDVLMEMFWAEDKDQRARRHSLSNALSFLRGILGAGAITTYRAEVLLVPGQVNKRELAQRDQTCQVAARGVRCADLMRR
jgi:DNA-binding SARP family transcriptional activator